MKTISLFSGCGGFDLGAEKAGAQIVWSNDLTMDACATLRKYFPDSEVVQGSIAEIDVFPSADLVIGGYPCQSFSMGGNRNPTADKKTYLYQHFARCLEMVQPKYFIAENVDGLKNLRKGTFLKQQIDLFEAAGKHGYSVTAELIDAKEFGVPQTRKRMFIVGVRNDLGYRFVFPKKTHGKNDELEPFTSHGEAIKHLPILPKGEFYERPHDLKGHWPWYYMSRNRKRKWDEPSYTIVANWRHVTLHPASPVMKMDWSDLADGFKQGWSFSNEYDHIKSDPSRPSRHGCRHLWPTARPTKWNSATAPGAWLNRSACVRIRSWHWTSNPMQKTEQPQTEDEMRPEYDFTGKKACVGSISKPIVKVTQ